MKKRLFSLTILSFFVQALFVSNLAIAAPAITISSPTEGQKITGNQFTVSGNTDPNSTVLIQKGTATLKQVISDASGNWSAGLSNLPEGNTTITAKLVKNTGYGYFSSTPDGGGTSKINRIRFSDDAINDGGAPWPVSSSRFILGVVPTPNTSIFYGVSGLFNPSALPAKLDVDNPADPVNVTGSYPVDSGSNAPSFSSDGSKAYFPNTQIDSVSVVDVATNAWIKDIPTTGIRPITAFATPDGKIIVSAQENKDMIIDPSTDTVVKNFTLPCAAVSFIFSDDSNYPYYYGLCINDGIILQLKRSDDSVNANWNVGNHPTGGYLTPDNSKLYFYSTTLNGTPGSDIIPIVDTATGSFSSTIQLSGEAVGFLASPDGQKLYVGIPGPSTSFSKNKIDVVDLASSTVTKTLTTPESPIAVGFSPATTRQISIANVSVILGASTSTGGRIGTLAETGAVMVSAIGLGTVILVIITYLFIDYRRHKRPLVQADPNVKYTFAHHLHQVSIPLFKYRISLAIKPVDSGPFSKF